MAEIGADRREQIEAAARSVSTRLHAFHEGLSPDERLVLRAALQPIGAGADEPTDDTTGHNVMVGTVTLGPATGAVRDAFAVEQLRQMVASIFGFSP